MGRTTGDRLPLFYACMVLSLHVQLTSLKGLKWFSPSLLSYRTCASIAVQLESLNQRSRSRLSSDSSSGAVSVGHGSSFLSHARNPSRPEAAD